jgi:hypothetical protein
MEDDLKPYTSSAEDVGTLPQYVRRRNVVPDVPEDVDYYMEHLNDPNLDLKKPLAEPISSDDHKKPSYAHSDTDVEYSDRASAPSRAGSRDSSAFEFDEYVFRPIIIPLTS